ncbi:MAG: hypothetical protein AB1611_08240 [bacterium]
MCDGHKKCQKPKDAADKPENCQDEQIKKCHGTARKHPCCKKDEKK